MQTIVGITLSFALGICLVDFGRFRMAACHILADNLFCIHLFYLAVGLLDRVDTDSSSGQWLVLCA